MNLFGDDYVSFVAMHLSFSPDGKYILVSTGKNGVNILWHVPVQLSLLRDAVAWTSL